jgi:hypothetical protein
VLAEVTRSVLRPAGEQLRVEVAGLGRDSALLGAAELAFAPLLADPIATLDGLGSLTATV